MPRYYGREVYEVWQQAQDKHKEAQEAEQKLKETGMQGWQKALWCGK